MIFLNIVTIGMLKVLKNLYLSRQSLHLLATKVSKRSSFLESTTSSQQQQTKKSSSPLPALGWHFGRSYIHILNSAPSSILILVKGDDRPGDV
jgi:hypothetical protein